MKMGKSECGIEENQQDLLTLSRHTRNGQVQSSSENLQISLPQVPTTIQSKYGIVVVVSPFKTCIVRRRKYWEYNGLDQALSSVEVQMLRCIYTLPIDLKLLCRKIISIILKEAL